MFTCWFHVIGTTYGTWLRGDPRGWSARHNREHSGPRTDADPRFFASQRLMRLAERSPVHLSPPAQRVALREFLASLANHEAIVRVLAIDARHFHLLARFNMPRLEEPAWTEFRKDGRTELACARHFVGIAKKDAARALSAARLAPAGGVWAKRCRCVPVRTNAQLAETAAYIRHHADQGALVWPSNPTPAPATLTGAAKPTHPNAWAPTAPL